MPPAIAAVAVGVAAGVAASSVVVGIAVAIGTVALQNSLKPDMPGVDESAREAQTLTTEPLQPRRGIYGECVVSGSIVGYGKRKLGDKEAHVVAVTLAGHNIEAAELYEVNGKTKPSGTTTEIFKGGQSSASATLLQYADGWTEDHIGFGLSYAVVTIPIDPEEMPSGLQNITFKVKGKRVYDPRKDTMVGGDGPHRANDETTWEWSDNTILCAFDYQRFHGYKLLGLNKFDLPHIMEQANICDELVSYTDSDGEEQTEKRFTCNGSWTFDQSPSRVLERLMSSCGGQPYRRGGKMYLQTASYHGMAEITLTDTDAAGEITITPHRELKDRTNTVRAAFQNPKKGYQPTDAPVVTNSIYVDRDGMELEDELQLNFTNSSTMAQRLMKYHLERNRAGMRLEFPCKSKGLLALAGTTVRVDLPNEGIDKEFIVQDWQFDFKAKKTKLILEEESPDLYSDSLVPSEGNVTPNTELPDLTRPEPPESLSFTLDPISTHRQGYVTWSHPIPRAVTEYRVVIRKDGDNIVEYPVIARSGAQLKQDINGLDAGQYSLEIYARNRYDRTSLPATISLTLNIPSPPTNLGITAGNWEVTSAPVLSGVGLGTVFEFAFEEVTNVIGLGMTIVKPGLKPATEYTLFARTVNPLGKSDWVSETFTTTNHDEQLSPWLQGIREELDAVDLVIDNWDSWNPAREVSEQLTNIFSDHKRQEDNRATLEVARDAGLTADGALEAINGIRAEIDDPASGLGATFEFAQQIKTTVDGNTNALNTLGNSVYDENTGLSATNTLAQSAKTGANNNASAISGLDSRVESNEEFAAAQLQLNATYDNELDQLVARAALITDVNDRITGMIIEDDGIERKLEFIGDSARFVDGNGQLKVYFSLTQGRFVFDGHVVARSGSFAGELQAASGTFTGELQAATGTFKGDLQAAKGTFSGYLSAAGGTFKGELQAASGSFSGSLEAASGTFKGNLQAAGGTFTGTLNGVDGNFDGTVKAEKIIGDVNNIKRVFPPSWGYWHKDTGNTAPGSNVKVCSLSLPAASYSRYVKTMNLRIGITEATLSSGAGALGRVEARLANGTVLNSWGLGIGSNGNKSTAGYEITIAYNEIRVLDGMLLPANQTRIDFYVQIYQTTGDITYTVAADISTFNSIGTYHPFVEVQTVVSGSSFGASIS
ncbi:MAG: hypothetical protein HLX50_14625 [Alteromonadaceae bacterium]|nr:hypothetical protein [Alteromonadaceae bacterium]